ncbi:MAG: tetratricopeptide repeat protein [Scytonema sp. CRU_2_7]|nr:tetratricopeptide repeat protein [Scytonema sp. CRU_2_7]
MRSNFVKSLEVQILFKQGNQLFNQGKYKEAIAKYNEILSIDKTTTKLGQTKGMH